MRHFQLTRALAWAVLPAVAFAMAFTTGCGSSNKGPDRTARAVQSFKDTRKDVADANKHVKATNDSLRALTSGSGDLRSAFNKYSDNVKKMQDISKNARQRAAAMREKTDAYTQAWQKELEGITDAELRKASEERAAAAKKEFEKVRSVAQEARAAYEPYMQGLQDVEKFLANDLTAGGVASARTKADETIRAGDTLQARLTALEAELDALSAQWSSKLPKK
jgi:hypothetical protein